MDCWHCRRTAVGCCRFCGRGICENHVRTQPYIIDLYDRAGIPHALVVDDALACGQCHPRPEPVPMPDLR